MKTFIAEIAGMYFTYEGEVAIKMSVPCNCPAMNRETDAKVVRELKTDFGELELHGYEVNK